VFRILVEVVRAALGLEHFRSVTSSIKPRICTICLHIAHRADVLLGVQQAAVSCAAAVAGNAPLGYGGTRRFLAAGVNRDAG
jgi:hypothetical protein